MKRAGARSFALALAVVIGQVRAADTVVVIGHNNVPRLDANTVDRVFTNRMIAVNGVFVTAVNFSRGDPVRSRFLRAFLNQSDDQYTAYMLSRKSVGLGKPPQEFHVSADVIGFVNSTPGAIGYIAEADVRPGMNVISKAASR